MNFSRGLSLGALMTEIKTDTHTEHCCLEHGCKYGHANCTVATGQKPQSYPCESCDFDREEREAAQRAMQAKVEKTHKDVDAVFEKYPSLDFEGGKRRASSIKIHGDFVGTPEWTAGFIYLRYREVQGLQLHGATPKGDPHEALEELLRTVKARAELGNL